MLPSITGTFRVVAEPDLRYSPSGVAVATVRAVASRRKKNEQTGEWEDASSCWVRLKSFKQMAENTAESLQKGDLINVIGRIETEEWEDKDGNKRTSINVLCDSLGPALDFNPATVQRSERGSGKTQKAVDKTFETPPPQDDEPPF